MSPEKRDNFESEGPFNVIIISFDTLRQDHVHAYGHPKPLSPAMDELAAAGTLFEDAVVNCGWTLPQHMTLLTGLYPPKHRLVHLKRRCHLGKRFRTLAEIFQENGYITLGFGNQNRYGGGWDYGFYRGMSHYTTIFPGNNMMEHATEPIINCLRFVDSRPFFMYIHTNDTHEPFAASEPFGSKWGPSYHNKYEGEVTYVDHYFGLILEELKRLNLHERTLVVATSDHGSEFKEHGFLEKKLNLYEEISQIPIIMALPGVLPAGKRVPGLCQTADIPATVLDICGLTAPEEMDGQSLLSRILGEDNEVPEFIFAHTLHYIRNRVDQYEHFSARTKRNKLIRTVPLSPWSDRFKRLSEVAQLKDEIWRELYDLKADPGEQNNVIESEPDMAHELENELDKWIASCGYKPLKSRMILPKD